MTRAQFTKYFKGEIAASISPTDKPALRQAWNDTIDQMIKDGQLPERAGDWSHPKYFYWYGSPENPKRESTYKRKTVDEYEIQGWYQFGWEVVTTEETWSAAKAQVKCYRENEPGTSFRIVCKRVKLEEGKLR